MIKIYTDGAATLKNENGVYSKGIGGWAYYALDGKGNGLNKNSGGLKETTNNECELKAIYEGLYWVKNLPTAKEIQIYSDSAYCINIFSNWIYAWEKNGWSRGKKHEPIENLELIKKIYELMKKFNFVEFVKVRGHNGDKYNEIVDKMAVEATLNMR